MRKEGFIVIAFIFLLISALSWAVTVGIIALICLCFKIKFSLLIATGIWLILILISSFFKQTNSK